MAQGGNRRLRELLELYDIARDTKKDILYSSKLLDFYRKLLKSEANNEQLPQQPNKNEALRSTKLTIEQNYNNYSLNNSNSSNNKFSSVSNTGNDTCNSNESNSFTKNQNVYSSNSNSNSNRFCSIGSSDNYDTKDDYEGGDGYLATISYWMGTALKKNP